MKSILAALAPYFNLNNTENDGQKRLIVGTHHKCGTVWMKKIFKRIAAEYGLTIASPTIKKGNLARFEQDTNILFQNHSRFDFARFRNYKGLHIIRDPRDLIVSACFYHMKSGEPWLHVKQDKHGGMSYQEKINSLSSLDDQLLFEMEHASRSSIRDISEWNYNNPHMFEIKYENLIKDVDLQIFRQLFSFLKFSEEEISTCLKIAYDNSLFSGKVKNSQHVRSGKSNQWKDYWRAVHKNRFIDLFGDVLIQLNYERDNSWQVER